MGIDRLTSNGLEVVLTLYFATISNHVVGDSH